MMVCTDDMTLSFVKKSRRKELSYFLGSIFVVIIFNLTYPLININDQTVIKYHDHPLETKKEIQPPPELLLSVPFYVYEELIWENATIGSRLVSDHARNYSGMNRPIFKHSDDYLFLEASLKHPQRTHNMDEAKLFFVPVLFNYLDMESISKGEPLCWNSMCRNELLHYSSQVLQKSRAFQQYPERHIHVRSHFGMLYDWWKKKQQGNKGYNEFMTLSAQMHTISFEGRDYITNRNPDRLVLPTYYVGSGCKQVDEKTHDVAMIASLHENRPWFQDRRNICLWLKKSSSITTSICGYGDKCPALAKSKFGIHARGDTWGSQRK